jgi:hypothetical protein
MAVPPEPGSRSAKAVAYMDFVKGKAPRTARPDWTFACWDEMAELVDTEKFVRVGKHGEAMSWSDAVALMDRHTAMPHDYTLRAATEVGDKVFLEMEEWLDHGGQTMRFNSVYIYTFNRADKIVRLEFYMQ